MLFEHLKNLHTFVKKSEIDWRVGHAQDRL